MRRAWLPGLVAATVLSALPVEASAQISAQILIHPPPLRWGRLWVRPQVILPPPPVVHPPAVYVQPPPVYVQPPPTPPQVVVQPPPVYVQPPPTPPQVVVQSASASLPPPRLVERPAWRQRVGLGARFAGILNTDRIEQSGHLGFGGELLFRVSRRVALEVAGEYQRTVDQGFARLDVPVTFGTRLHIGLPDWVVSPYFVLATGIDYARLDFIHAYDNAWFVEGQAGGGLEVRLGHRVGLTADVRGVGRLRLTAPEEAVAATVSINGKPFYPMQNHLGVQFRLGVAVYF
ncbi:MAG: hypothetical protein NZ890_20050 [Myxococcota bacterium]|nr:hypothetical protein [Myxococcota bacterium]